MRTLTIVALCLLLASCNSIRRGVSRAECKRNSATLLVLVPLEGDVYGVTSVLMKQLLESCFKVDFIPNVTKGTDLIELGRSRGAYALVYGQVFTVDVPYVPPQKSGASGPYTFGDAYLEGVARGRAGLWVAATTYFVNMQNGNLKPWMQAERLWKL